MIAVQHFPEIKSWYTWHDPNCQILSWEVNLQRIYGFEIYKTHFEQKYFF
jgi:hypothetical protein